MVTSSYPRFPGDSAGTFVRSLAQALTQLGHSVRVVAPADPAYRRAGPAAVSSADGDIPLVRFPYSPLPGLNPMGYGKALVNDQHLRPSARAFAVPYFLSGAAHLLNTLHRWHCDVVHAHWVLPNGPLGALAAKITRTPLVITLHGSDAFLARHSALLGWLASWSLAGAEAVTTCSRDLAQDAQALGVVSSRTHLIPWGADAARFGGGDGQGWRERLGISADRPVVVAVGRLVEKKGFGYLLEAFSRVRGCRTDRQGRTAPVLVLGGEGPLRRELESQAEQLDLSDSLRLCGQVAWDDMPDLLAMADVVAVPSVRDASGNLDGLPTVVLEAMAAGKAVVASNVAGLPLAVQHERTGLLVPPQDATALAAALDLLLSNPQQAEAFGAAARARVKEELNWEAIAARYVEVYRGARGDRACVS